MNETSTTTSGSLWRHRGRRFATGINVVVSVLIAATAAGLINYLASKHVARWDWSTRDYYKLSDKTRGLLSGLHTNVQIVSFFQKNHELHDDITHLLKEYEYEDMKRADRKLNIVIVDPDRDLARTREMAKTFDVKDPNVVVFEAEGRRKYVDAKQISDYEINISGRSATQKRSAFRGEQTFSSAIQSVALAARPVVYFLSGHGERDINDFGRQSGYSRLATVMRRDNIEVKTLILADRDGVPSDCSLLIIAGAEKKLAQSELDLLSTYLKKNGRMLLLLDPALDTGLDALMADWGVKLDQDVVVGRTIKGRDLVIYEYGVHPITRNMGKIVTMFYMPRSVEPVEGSSEDAPADRPRATVLAFTSEGWADMNLKESPPRFQSGVDRPGPVSVALAVERGAVAGIEVELKPTRLVVIGDSYFVSNGALEEEAVGGNIDFFMSCANWLLEREELMAISPRIPDEIRLDMDSSQIRLLFIVIIALIPSLAALAGFAVWIVRR